MEAVRVHERIQAVEGQERSQELMFVPSAVIRLGDKEQAREEMNDWALSVALEQVI